MIREVEQTSKEGNKSFLIIRVFWNTYIFGHDNGCIMIYLFYKSHIKNSYGEEFSSLLLYWRNSLSIRNISFFQSFSLPSSRWCCRPTIFTDTFHTLALWSHPQTYLNQPRLFFSFGITYWLENGSMANIG